MRVRRKTKPSWSVESPGSRLMENESTCGKARRFWKEKGGYLTRIKKGEDTFLLDIIILANLNCRLSCGAKRMRNTKRRRKPP